MLLRRGDLPVHSGGRSCLVDETALDRWSIPARDGQQNRGATCSKRRIEPTTTSCCDAADTHPDEERLDAGVTELRDLLGAAVRIAEPEDVLQPVVVRVVGEPTAARSYSS